MSEFSPTLNERAYSACVGLGRFGVHHLHADKYTANGVPVRLFSAEVDIDEHHLALTGTHEGNGAFANEAITLQQDGSYLGGGYLRGPAWQIGHELLILAAEVNVPQGDYNMKVSEDEQVAELIEA